VGATGLRKIIGTPLGDFFGGHVLEYIQKSLQKVL
jgi:hypothetical protein